MTNIEKWVIIPEPQTPQQAKRLTLQQKHYLLAQRNLARWIDDPDGDEWATKALITLGHFEDAAARCTQDCESSGCHHFHARALLGAVTTANCGCGPQQLLVAHAHIPDSTPSIPKVISNYHAVQEYPQGTLWRCIACDHLLISPGYPDSLAANHHEARIENKGIGFGPDYIVLKDAPTDNKTI